MYSACKLNKQGDIIQPWRIPFPIWNQSIVPYPGLTVASWLAYRFLRRQIRWYSIPKFKNFPQFFVIHTVRGFSIVNEAEVDVFLEFPYFLYDPTDVGNSISGSSFLNPACTSGNSWFTYCLKPSLKDFEHYLPTMWNECNCVVAGTFFCIVLLCNQNENWPFPLCQILSGIHLLHIIIILNHLLSPSYARQAKSYNITSPWPYETSTLITIFYKRKNEVLSFLSILT